MTPRNRGRWVTASADASLQKFCAIVADFCWKNGPIPAFFLFTFVHLKQHFVQRKLRTSAGFELETSK